MQTRKPVSVCICMYWHDHCISCEKYSSEDDALWGLVLAPVLVGLGPTEPTQTAAAQAEATAGEEERHQETQTDHNQHRY